jgi:hypothetical protein
VCRADVQFDRDERFEKRETKRDNIETGKQRQRDHMACHEVTALT